MFDIITFGSASQDIYVESKNFLFLKNKKFIAKQGLCFNLGAKIKLEKIMYFSGGGGTNTAASFARQGLQTAYCGMIGDDFLGMQIIQELENLKINTELVQKDSKYKTNTSFILNYPGRDKTALVYRGASDNFSAEKVPWEKIKNTKWFYLAPFSGKMALMTERLVNFAKNNGIKVAINPGYGQLVSNYLKRILKKADVLILNREEATLITKIPYNNERGVFKKLDDITEGICIMTKGKDGVSVSDGKYFYSASSLCKNPVDTTGAGDSFGSGFVAGFVKRNDIIYAIQLGLANSAANLKKFGAKDGLLSDKDKFVKINVKKILI